MEVLYCLLSAIFVLGLYALFELNRRKAMKKITGRITIDWLSKDGFNLYFEAIVTADHYYIPAKKYLPNGDVGYPAEGETEIKQIDFEVFEIWDDGYQLSEDFVKAHPEYKEFCKKWILENEEEIKWDEDVA